MGSKNLANLCIHAPDRKVCKHACPRYRLPLAADFSVYDVAHHAPILGDGISSFQNSVRTDPAPPSG
jgi:hypothetical protein